MTANGTTVSSWVYPGAATNVTLLGLLYSSVEFNNTITEFLRQQVLNHPKDGIGSGRPVHVKDTIKLDHTGLTEADLPLERTCLVCTQPYSGEDGWGACDQFTDTTATKPYRDLLTSSDLEDISKLDNDDSISAAICAFGINTDPYDLSAAYPFINKPRREQKGGIYTPSLNSDAESEGDIFTFSKESPTGFRASPDLPSTTLMSFPPLSTSSSLKPDTPKPQGHDSNVGIVVGGIVGGAFGFSIIVWVVLRLCEKKWPKEAATVRAKINRTNSLGQRGQNGCLSTNAPRRTVWPRPPVRDRLGSAERGERCGRGWREDIEGLDADGIPPPAYEEAVVSVAREAADRERVERERINAQDMERDRARARARERETATSYRTSQSDNITHQVPGAGNVGANWYVLNAPRA